MQEEVGNVGNIVRFRLYRRRVLTQLCLSVCLSPSFSRSLKRMG